ncbi:hypothetical protein D3C75_1105640 [compost metagenome]
MCVHTEDNVASGFVTVTFVTVTIDDLLPDCTLGNRKLMPLCANHILLYFVQQKAYSSMPNRVLLYFVQ